MCVELTWVGGEGWGSNGGSSKGGGPNPEKVWPRRVEPRRVGGPKGGGPKISRFFFPVPPQNSFFSSLSGGLLVEFWWCLKRRGSEMCSFGVLGLSCAASRPPGFHMTTREPKRAHFSVPALRKTKTLNPPQGIGAFDLISRGAMSDGLRSVAGGDSVLPFVVQFYGNPSSCLWDDDDGETHEIRQGEGKEQGDPFAHVVCSRAAPSSVVSAISPPSTRETLGSR